jgi:hypothetical protein
MTLSIEQNTGTQKKEAYPIFIRCLCMRREEKREEKMEEGRRGKGIKVVA